jgi:hypothetical protein
MPTRPVFGEGQCGMGKQPTEAPVSIRRGTRHGTLAKVLRVIGGDPFWVQVAAAMPGKPATRAGVGQGRMSGEAG